MYGEQRGKAMTKQTMQSIRRVITMRGTIRNLKAAVVWMFLLAMIWNPTVIPVAEGATRDRRSSKPISKSASKPAKLAAALQGQTMTVWGPQQVVRQPLNTTYTANFSLPSGALPPYQMTVSNGAFDGTKKVTQACIQLNGVNVLTPTCYSTLNPTPQVRTVWPRIQSASALLAPFLHTSPSPSLVIRDRSLSARPAGRKARR
jgi:hypothetical protein